VNFFNFSLRKVIVFTAAILIPFILIKMHRTSKETPLVLRPFTFTVGLIQNAYSSFSSGVRGTTSLYLNLVDIKRDNRSLMRKNAELRAQLGTMTELKLENERLNQLLEFKTQTKMQLLAGRVVGQDLIPEHSTITINRGTYHGVEQGMAVLTVSGAVGYILQAEMLNSQVILITDRFSAVDALVQRTRARGIVSGISSEACKFNYLKRGDDVAIGDQVVTSGLDNIFPKGFPVGEVIKVEQSEYGVTKDVELRPAVNPNNLEEIFIVLNAAQEDFLPSEEESDSETPNKETEIDKSKKALGQASGSANIER
tara:strand:- start:8290 stop:9225 length:936 start_codon:yes stop_codon:yes gene_type:complete